MNTLPTTNDAKDVMQAWRESVVELIGKDMGALMPKEMLSEVVKQAIEGELNRKVNSGIHGEPWIQKKVRETVAEEVRKVAVKEIDARVAEIGPMVVEEVKKIIPNALGMMLMGMLQGNTSFISNEVYNVMHSCR